jgi:hypothetical protein
MAQRAGRPQAAAFTYLPGLLFGKLKDCSTPSVAVLKRIFFRISRMFSIFRLNWL